MQPVKSLLLALTLGLFLLGAHQAVAAEIAVVNVDQVIAESTPGKTIPDHMKKVQSVLQKGLDDLQAMYKGKETTPEAQQAIGQGYAALQQQLAIEQQAAVQAVYALVQDEVAKWRTKNKTAVVISTQGVIDVDPKADITKAILAEVNKRKVTFPDLPSVKVNAPEKKN